MQEKGRVEILRDYHLRVGQVTRDTRLPDGQVLPEQRLDETEAGAAHHGDADRCATPAGAGQKRRRRKRWPAWLGLGQTRRVWSPGMSSTPC